MQTLPPATLTYFNILYHNAKRVYTVESFMSGDVGDKGAGEMNHCFI